MKKNLQEQISRIKGMMDINESKKESYYIKDPKGWVGGDTSRKRFDDLDDDYEDDDEVNDVDTLLKKYPDSYKHYSSLPTKDDDFKKQVMSTLHKNNPVKVKRLKKRD